MFGIPYRIERPISHGYHPQLGLEQTPSSCSGCRPRTRSGQVKIYARDQFERLGGRGRVGLPFYKRVHVRHRPLPASPSSHFYELRVQITSYELQFANYEYVFRQWGRVNDDIFLARN
jgi:hypothetical protein